MKTMKTELSPAAQAVKDAALAMYADCNVRRMAWPLDMPVVAAALRAAANQCKIEWNYHPDYPETESVIVVSDLLTIVSELEGQP
jgi:hypothetical protein